METEIGTALDRYLAWLNDVEKLGTLLVASAYLRKATVAYEKLQPKVKEKVEFRSFLVGFMFASWETDFPEKQEKVATTPPVSSPILKDGVSTGAN